MRTPELTHCAVCPQAGWRAQRLQAAQVDQEVLAATCCNSAPSHSPHDKYTRQPTQHALAPTQNNTPFALHFPDSVTKGRTFVHESWSGRECQVRTGPVSVRASRRARTERVSRQLHRRTPRTSHPTQRTPAAAVTLRADHTPNNAAGYYLLLRFICSYIGLMVSDRCERLRPTV